MDSIKPNGSFITYCKASLFASFLIFSIYPALVESQSNSQIFNSLVQKADSLLHIGKYKEAEIAYQQALVFNKRSTRVFKGLGKIAYARENWTEFHKCFTEVLKIDSTDAEAKEYLTHKSKVWLIVVKADSLRTLGDLKQAEKTYKKALNLDDEYIKALKGLGRIAYEKRDWKNLRKWIKKALKFDPEDAEAMDLLNNNPQIRSILLRADSLSRAGNMKAADKAYKQLLKINRESIVALKWFGQRAFVKKDWGEVKKWYNKVLKAQPLDLEANYWLGVAYRETGKFKSLILKSKDFNKAKKYFDVIIRRDSTYSDVFYQRALLEKLNEHWVAAIKLAQRQIRLKPNLIHATVGLFKLYRLFLVHESDAEVENWLKNNKGEWSTYILAEHYRRTKNFLKAESSFQELLQKNLTMSKEPIYLSLVRLYLQQDNQNEANKYFQMALDSMATDLDVEFMFEDSKYIFTDKEFGFLRKLSAVDQEKTFFQRFWTYRNPIPSYSINVRAMEHFKRLLYAEKNYWFDGLRSWATRPDKVGYLKFPRVYDLNQEFNDKGLIYLRHGPPDDIAVTPNTTTSNESWYYNPRADREKLIFHFVIDENATGNNWQLTPYLTDRRMLQDRSGWDPMMDRLLLASEQVEFNSLENQLADQSQYQVFQAMSSDYHTWDKSTKVLSMPYYLAYSRAPDTETHIEIYFGIPMNELSSINRMNLNEVFFQYGVAIYDTQWDKITQSQEKVELNIDDSTRIFNHYFVNRYGFNLQPGSYNLTFHAKETGTSKIGGWNFKTVVPSFEKKVLSLSDLTIAYNIYPDGATSRFKRGELAVVPNPSKIYHSSEPVYLYYEIYNLSKNNDGETSFEIENEMTQLGKKQKSISIKETRTGKEETSIEYTSFDVSKLDQGEYSLTITVKDLNSKKKAEKSIRLRVNND